MKGLPYFRCYPGSRLACDDVRRVHNCHRWTQTGATRRKANEEVSGFTPPGPCSARSYRNIAHGRDPLSRHEVHELAEDFAIDVHGGHVVAVLTKSEWTMVTAGRSPNADICHER